MENNNDRMQYMFRFLGVIVFAGVILYVGKPLFIPLSFALFISFILQPVCSNMERHGIGRVVAIFIGIFGVTVIFSGMLYLAYRQFLKFIQEWPAVREKVASLIQNIKSFFITEMEFSTEQVEAWSSMLL